MHNVEYGFHPNLEAITIGEYADIEQYVQTGLETNMHKIMGVLYRPIVEEKDDIYTIEVYDSDSMKIRAEAFKKMKAKDVQSALVFFWTLGNELLKILEQFLEKQKKNLNNELEKKLQKINLLKNGAGSQ